jgi:hypothetical protein
MKHKIVAAGGVGVGGQVRHLDDLADAVEYAFKPDQ